MAVETKDFVREYYVMGFSVQDTMAVLNLNLDTDFTWEDVADMYEEIYCKEEGK